METVTTDTLTIPTIETAPVQARWTLATRLAFRFAVLYFTSYVVTTQMWSSLVILPRVNVPSAGQIPWLQAAVTGIATKVLGFPAPLTIFSGSGDKPYDFALVVFLLAFATLGTIVWSALALKRASHPAVHAWFRLFLRFAIGASMVTYGMFKFFPLQMSYPGLTRLLEPYGQFSLMGVLWAQVGASPAYERFTGAMELVSGILLFIPGLSLLGAAACAASAGYIFTLNMTYDVPVKLFSLHLTLMSLYLLAPDARRLFRFFVLDRGVEPAARRPLVHRPTVRKVLIVAQLVVGAWIVWSNYAQDVERYKVAGPNAPKPALYGVWDVERMYIDGVERSPLLTDYDRWRRVVVQAATAISFQRMDDTFSTVRATVDANAHSIVLTRAPQGAPGPTAANQPPPAETGRFAYEQPSPDRLVLNGTMDGKRTKMELRLYDRNNFRLVQSKFRWVQDFPFNR
ncbi:MAG TPA: hypothetical protein VF147_14735 [Vicinamibacterales bacterium]